ELPVGPTTRIVIADATDKRSLDAQLGEERFDVIIDDGSHVSEDVVTAFETCFPRLTQGGSYIIEDLHASYWSSHAGGLNREGTAIEWLKSLVDGLHADHVPEGDRKERLDDVRAWRAAVGSVSFYDSIAIVRKLSVAKSDPYPRIFTGSDAPVADVAGSIVGVWREHPHRVLLTNPL